MKQWKGTAIRIIILYFLIFIGWLLIFNSHPFLLSLGSNLFLTIAAVISGYWFLKVYLQQKTKERYFWLILAFAVFFALLAQGTYLIYQLVLQAIPPYPSIADFFWIIENGLFLLALIYKVFTGESSFPLIRFLYNISIIMAAVATFSWEFVLKHIFRTAFDSLWTTLITVAYPLMDLGLLTVTIGLYFISLKSPFKKSLFFIILGFLIQIFADSIYIFQSIHGQYMSGSLIDPLWGITLLVKGMAALYALDDTHVVNRNESQQAEDNQPEFIHEAIPYIGVIALIIFIIFYHTEDFIIGTSITILLVILRQVSILAENRSLLRRLKFAKDNLTHEVQQRTAELEKKNHQLAETAQKLEYLAFHDELTSLPNRTFFYDDLKKTIEQYRDKHRKCAILFIDLDKFKLINDTMGHGYGDQLLKLASERILQAVDEGHLVSRYGGDEFIILLKEMDQKSVIQIAKRILTAFGQAFVIGDQEIYSSPSIGISMFPIDGNDIETLIKHADIAMYIAKEKGRNNYQFFAGQSNETLSRKMELEKGLRKALENNELVIYYQPKVNLRSGKITGAEALLRWHHPEYGIISPVEFIPIAEETGLISDIGKWTLRNACAQNKIWQENGIEPMVVSVNLSARQFHQPDLVAMIEEILHETSLAAQYLDIEITESMTMNILHTATTLKQLKRLGVKISIDDFGKGYSSLFYLKNFPIDQLKIDQSFVRDSTIDINDANIVKTIISIAQNLKLRVIAEGVETKEHLLYLQQNLCDEGQGFFFSPPLTGMEFEKQYRDIGEIIKVHGLSRDLNEQLRYEETVRRLKQDLEDTVNQQEGMIFKFTLQDGRFVYTMCNGKLLYKLDLTPEQMIGRSPEEIFNGEITLMKEDAYRKAWSGEQRVFFEVVINGICVFVSLTPVIRGGEVTEVIGSCMDISELVFRRDLQCQKTE